MQYNQMDDPLSKVVTVPDVKGVHYVDDVIMQGQVKVERVFILSQNLSDVTSVRATWHYPTGPRQYVLTPVENAFWINKPKYTKIDQDSSYRNI